MKKNFFLAAAVLITSSVFGQTTSITSKNGHEVLPQAGDIAIGMNAAPVINFALNAVNIMNNTGAGAQHPGFVSGFNQVIVGKYFLSESQALRARIGINTANFQEKFYGNNPLNPSNPNPENILLRTNTAGGSGIMIGAGMEMRRGHNRLQGFYGGELMLGFGSNKTINKYEIEYNQTAQDSGFIGTGSARLLEDRSGTSIALGLRGFAGVEYFIAPKISIGAEFGWGLGYTTAPRGTTVIERWDDPAATGTNSRRTEEIQGNTSGRFFGFLVDDGSTSMPGLGGGSAALMIHFHF
jgi:hypothetical protein